MTSLKAGDGARKFTLLNQSGIEVSLTDFKGKKFQLYFYPKADTPDYSKHLRAEQVALT